MGLFEHFPYTNFHELNLGWFLNKFKSLLTEWASYITIFNGIRDEAEAAAEDAHEALSAAEIAQGAAENALAQANTTLTAANNAVTEAQTTLAGAEAALAGAEAAQAAAEAAQTAAETAQTGAEAAQTAAEAAQTAAETAQTGAEAAQTAAETAQTAAENALRETVIAKNAAVDAAVDAVDAQTAAEAAANRAEEAAAVTAVLRVVYNNTNGEIDTTQAPVIESGTYSDIVSKINAGTPVKILVFSNDDVSVTKPTPIHRVIQNIYPVTRAALTTSLINIALYYWPGNLSVQPKNYSILWSPSGISIAPVQ